MSHHHDHDHSHGHQHHAHPHDHDHHDHSHGHHDHSREEQGGTALTFDRKMARILDHWIDHNDDHAQSYRKWAGDARTEGKAETADLLEQAAEMTLQISEIFKKAARADGGCKAE